MKMSNRTWAYNIEQLITMVNEEKKNARTLICDLEEKQKEIRSLKKEREELMNANRNLSYRVVNLEQLRDRDLYEKELMLADVDSVVKRDETIDEIN
jgi:septal ring factor EnvC (AmiA/AmiB activator)